MPSLICLFRQHDPELMHALTFAGFHLLELHTVSEALLKAKREHIDAVVIGPGFDDGELTNICLNFVTMRLDAGARIEDVVEGLSVLFWAQPWPAETADQPTAQ